MKKEDIEKKALEAIKTANYIYDNDAVDIIAIAKALEFEVGNAALDEDDDGFILVNDKVNSLFGVKTSRLIGVNANRGLAWKRFIIAHEIGHYILHYSSMNQNGLYAHRDRKKGKSDIENDADFFAANILMPKEKFQEQFDSLKSKGLNKDEMIVLLSEKFVVPAKSAERRLEELGLTV